VLTCMTAAYRSLSFADGFSLQEGFVFEVLLRDNVVPILSDVRKHFNVHVQPIDQTQDAQYRSENQLSGRISRLKTWMFHYHPLIDGGSRVFQRAMS
jgi:hypothetical protein